MDRAGNHGPVGQIPKELCKYITAAVCLVKNLNLKSTFGNRISRLLLISKHSSSQKINPPNSQNSENALATEKKTGTRNIFDKRLSVDEIDELSMEDIEKGVTQELIKNGIASVSF